MRKSFLLAGALSLAAFSMAASEPAVARAAAPQPTLRPEVRRQRMPDGAPYSRNRRRKLGPGWTTRQVQRMAAKRRNVARNRAHHKAHHKGGR